MKKLIAVNIEIEQTEYLDNLRINKSNFVRQAIEAYKLGKFEYKHKSK